MKQRKHKAKKKECKHKLVYIGCSSVTGKYTDDYICVKCRKIFYGKPNVKTK